MAESCLVISVLIISMWQKLFREEQKCVGKGSKFLALIASKAITELFNFQVRQTCQKRECSW